MRKLKIHITLIVIWTIFFSGFYSEWTAPKVIHQFGFAINPSANNALITYGVVTTNQEGKIVKKQIVPRNNFVLQVVGQQYSPANPIQENLWDKNEIGKCYYWLNSLEDKYETIDCDLPVTIDDLWRLRYAQNPMRQQGSVSNIDILNTGWAANTFKPSFPQIQILQKYGVTYVNDFFYGENMFKVMKAVQDTAWVGSYIGAGSQ